MEMVFTPLDAAKVHCFDEAAKKIEEKMNLFLYFSPDFVNAPQKNSSNNLAIL